MGNEKLKEDWVRLEQWYRQRAKPILEEWDATRVPSLDATRGRLDKLVEVLDSQFKVCILGKSGVGKSTLLNALLDEKLAVLPQGGIGPLTAQAIVVHHAPEAFFEVKYHGRKKLNQLLFVIQGHAAAELGQDPSASLKEIEAELDEEDLKEVRFESKPGKPGDVDADRAAKTNSYLQQGRLLVQGDQFSSREDIRYIVDGVRACLDLTPVYASKLTEEDAERVAIVRGALPPRTTKRGPVQVIQRRVTRASPAFFKELKLHAAGALAPLVFELEVGWPAALLASGAALVDLPGVGIAGDDYPKVTRLHVKSSRAIGIVVDRAGIDAASAELLRETGFLNALLLESGDEVIEPVHLFIAVVKLDMTANDRVNEAANEGEHLSWLQCFEEARTQAIQMLKNQLARELAKIVDDTGESTRPEMAKIVARLLASVQVFPVAAMEYRNFFLKNGAKIDEPGQSYIPQLGEAIASAAQQRRHRVATAFAQDLTKFRASLESTIGVLHERVRQDTRAEAEIRALREEFERFSAPLGKELVARKAAFRTFLRETVPAEIDAAVMHATDEVRKDIQRHLRRYQTYPWQTLRATIRRGGAFVGARTVDLPTELTLKFEEPIALLWSKVILSLIRRRTRELGDDYVRIGKHVVDWTRAQGGRVPPRIAELLEEDLRTDVNQLASVGKDAIDDLKQRVKDALFDASQKRIRRSCEEFTKGGQDVGEGVKRRMQAFFEGELADSLLDATRPAALKVLKDNYTEVQDEVLAALKTLVDPVERASELVIERQASTIHKKDQDQRQRLANALAQLKVPAAL